MACFLFLLSMSSVSLFGMNNIHMRKNIKTTTKTKQDNDSLKLVVIENMD